VFGPGDSWGYSNSGFVLAGAAIEELTGGRFEDAVSGHLEAVGAGTLVWSLEPPPAAAGGHQLTGDGVRPADLPTGQRAMAPAGTTVFATAAGTLSLAERLLADWNDLAAEAGAMPPGGGTAATHQALGWRVYRWGDTVMFGHDGGASGMGSFVRWIPDRRTGIAVMSNTNPSAMLLWADLSEWFFASVGVTVPPWLTRAPDARPEPELCGLYKARDVEFTVSPTDDGLSLVVEGLGGALRRSANLKPLSAGVYRADSMITDPTRTVTLEQPQGEYRLIHSGPFTARQVSTERR
jgi:CubicO group peptidase (beta-lactamase class C family)